MLRRPLLALAIVSHLALLGPFAAGPLRAQTLSDLATAARSLGQGIFGSVEFEANSLRALPQWNRILRSAAGERRALERCAADEAHCGTSVLKAWRRIITAGAGLGRRAKLQAVNRFFNRWPYKQDSEIYGAREYWASPTEFMARSGDCEDYAIAKYFALRQLGFRNDELRIVVIWDKIRNIGHAVLAVYEPDDILVLDSLSPYIVSNSRYRHYVPQYSMNETTRWAHITDRSKPAPALANRD